MKLPIATIALVCLCGLFPPRLSAGCEQSKCTTKTCTSGTCQGRYTFCSCVLDTFSSRVCEDFCTPVYCSGKLVTQTACQPDRCTFSPSGVSGLGSSSASRLLYVQTCGGNYVGVALPAAGAD